MNRRFSTGVMGLATGCLWLTGGSVQAFFPPLPIGTGPVTVIPQPPRLPVAPDGNLTPVPPVPAPPFTLPPTREVPQEIPNPPHPQVVPEPASVISAATGLAVVAAAARRRRKPPAADASR